MPGMGSGRESSRPVEQRLDREHLVEIAAHGFDCIELFATRAHFDYHDSVAVLALREWLDDTRLTLNSMHAPICASLVNGAMVEPYSNAIADESRRLARIVGDEFVERSIPLDHSAGPVRIRGWIGVPAAARISHSRQARASSR